MKHSLLILLLCITFGLKAQYVTIPDINLRTALQIYIPECFNASGQLDTVCAANLTITGLGIEGLDIQSLEGMQYFKGFSNLYCGDNLLTDLKFLPPNITFLNAPNNKITSIDSLPKNLQHLFLEENALKSLPPLPATLKYLGLSYNPDLSCLPVLPPNLETITTYQTNINCLPNKPGGLTTHVPLCNTVNNRSNCQAFPVISGRVFVDLNNNGIKDPNEPYRKGIKVRIASEDVYTFSNDTGYYEISVHTLNSYEVSVSNPYYSSTPSTVFVNNFNHQSDNNIALKISQPAKDLAISITNYGFARPGFGLAFKVELDNIGSEATTADLSLLFPALYTIDSTSVLGTVQSGTMNWQYPTLLPGEHRTILLYGTLNASAVLGSEFKISITVNPLDSEDHDLSNNVSTIILIIRGAYDPNDKQASATLSPQEVSDGEYIYYTIRFQNTGTDTAFTVIVKDQLDNQLQVSTLELLSASHSCQTIVEDRNINFKFTTILLPDSNVNKLGSCGFVKFRIKPVTNVMAGEIIPNTASIYFDYNSPVVTNTAKTLVAEPVVSDIQDNGKATVALQIFPNPVENGILHISKGASYKIHNHQGIIMMQGHAKDGVISMEAFPAGLYLVEISKGKNYAVEKIILR